MISRVELWGHHGFFAAIVPCASGVVWTNQCGGTYCAHPEVEGILIPLPLDWLPETNFLENCWEDSPAGHCRDCALEFLRDSSVHMAELDTEYTDRWGEAWVPVRFPECTDRAPHPVIELLAGKRAILTYCNSD